MYNAILQKKKNKSMHHKTGCFHILHFICAQGIETYFDGFLPLLKLSDLFPLFSSLSECQSGFKSLLV